MTNDATCFLRAGYVIQGKGLANWHQRAIVVGNDSLTALVRLDSGEELEVDQFSHDWEVLDRGEPDDD